MNWGAYVILIIFGAFVVLLIINPNISCFGKRVRSPFYPLRRKRAMKRKLTDYKFDLGGKPPKGGERGKGVKAGGSPAEAAEAEKKAGDKKTDDYGFRLD